MKTAHTNINSLKLPEYRPTPIKTMSGALIAPPTCTGLITLMDDAFLPGALVCLKSLLHHNPGFDLTFIVLDCGLSEATKQKIKSVYPKTEFRQIQKQNYKHINTANTPVRLRNTFYTLDVFAQTDFDRLIFLDMDTLIMGDLTLLFKETAVFAAAQCYKRSKDVLIDEINSGVFVVNKPAISDEVYRQLLAIAPNYPESPDQQILNAAFKGRIKYLDKAFNVEKRLLHARRLSHYRDPRNIRILHFVGVKPWASDEEKKREQDYTDFERLWRVWA
jgi:lipopolysaccharide biosynthesis glycosyltransferase